MLKYCVCKVSSNSIGETRVVFLAYCGKLLGLCWVDSLLCDEVIWYDTPQKARDQLPSIDTCVLMHYFNE